MKGNRKRTCGNPVWIRAAVVLLLMSVLASVMPDVMAKRETSGTFEGTEWSYNTKTKTLTLSCKGEMDDGRTMYLEGWWPWEVWRGEMKRIEVKEGVTYLGYNTAGRCHNVKSVFLPKSLKEIGNLAFADTKLAGIKLPANLKVIGDEAFSNTKLKKVVIPPSVKDIYWGAFRRCKQLTKVQLPKNLKWIDGAVFAECPKLKTITLPSNIKQIGSNLFCKSGLTAITIPKKVTYMGGEAFKECTALKEVTFQTNKLATIRTATFEGCSSLTAITLPDTITRIHPKAFKGSGLTTVTIPEGVIMLGELAFLNCESLKEVTFQTNRLAAIEISTFEGCRRLTAITLPDSITRIHSKAFKGSGLTTVTIPERVTKIDELAFLNCKSLKEVTFAGSQVTNIGTNAFCNVVADCVFRVPAGQTEMMKPLLTVSGLSDSVVVVEY